MPGEDYSSKNYREQGGQINHIGGKLQIEVGATVVPASGVVAAAVATVTGGATVDAEARTALNAILVALRNLGMIAP